MRPMDFEILGDISQAETIASGAGVREAPHRCGKIRMRLGFSLTPLSTNPSTDNSRLLTLVAIAGVRPTTFCILRCAGSSCSLLHGCHQRDEPHVQQVDLPTYRAAADADVAAETINDFGELLWRHRLAVLRTAGGS